VQRNQDGRLEVFASGRCGIFNIWQVVPNSSWAEGWHSKDRPSANVGLTSYVVGTNADGRLEIFAVGDDHALWQKWQVAPNNGWSAWKTLGTPASETAVTDQWQTRSLHHRQWRQRLADLANCADRRLERVEEIGPAVRWSPEVKGLVLSFATVVLPHV